MNKNQKNTSHSVLKSILDNTFLPNYNSIQQYFNENNLVYNNEDKINEGFTLNFCPSEVMVGSSLVGEELYKKNLKTQPDDWYYRTHPVKYTLNSLGYRTKEFDDIDWGESIIVFGCSFVFGTGVTDEHTIPYFLEQLSGRPVVNMGIPRSSIQTALHNSIILNDSQYPTPKAVVYLWIYLSRFHIYENNYINYMGDWNVNKNIQTFSNLENTIPFNLMNIKMIRNLWKNKTIYYEGDWINEFQLINKLDDEVYCHSVDFREDLARDMMHLGSKTNFKIAKKIYQKIKSQLDK